MQNFFFLIIFSFIHVGVSLFNAILPFHPSQNTISWIVSFILCLLIILSYYYCTSTNNVILNFSYQDYIFSENQKQILDYFKNELAKGKKLTFIHIPKCGGTFVRHFLPKKYIKYKTGHQPATKNDVPCFSIIRHPVERFESVLRYRMDRIDQYKDLKNIVNLLKLTESSISLENIVNHMTDEDILSMDPFQSIEYYKKNVQFMILIEYFVPMLKYLNIYCKEIDISLKVNKTNHSMYGELSQKNKERILNLFESDYILYEYWKNY